ncbi:MAG: hypothetical protein AAGK05_11390, partial [Pseudomonadota bacterium]
FPGLSDTVSRLGGSEPTTTTSTCSTRTGLSNSASNLPTAAVSTTTLAADAATMAITADAGNICLGKPIFRTYIHAAGDSIHIIASDSSFASQQRTSSMINGCYRFFLYECLDVLSNCKYIFVQHHYWAFSNCNINDEIFIY